MSATPRSRIRWFRRPPLKERIEEARRGIARGHVAENAPKPRTSAPRSALSRWGAWLTGNWRVERKGAGWTGSDVVLAACGLALGLVCAFFPWYVFFNQEQFGPPAVRFSGARDAGPIPIHATPAGDRILADSDAPLREIAEFPVDAFTTGTLAEEDRPEPPGVNEQPFPAPAEPAYRIVHIANGRAMIEDDRGLWIVERGSLLPDNAEVRSIEQRDGRWVVVTDSQVLEPQP